MDRQFIDEWISMHEIFRSSLREKGLSVDLFEAEDSSLGSEIKIRGISENVTSFVSLDYLGLGNFEPLKKIAAESILKYGTGLASSRSMFDSFPHKKFEQKLAEFKGTTGSALLNTGYTASCGAIKLLAFEMSSVGKRMRNKPPSLVVMDELVHASFQEILLPTRRKKDGFVRTEVYRHLDYAMAEDILSSNSDFSGQRFILSDSLFSMNGSFVDTRILLELAKRYNCIIILDGAHSDGVYGDEGRGILQMQGISDKDREYFIEVGTLSKAFAAFGGYIAMPQELCALVPMSYWGYLFSVALPTHLVVSSLETLKIIMGAEGQRRRDILQKNSRNLIQELYANGFNTLNSDSHIIPIVIGKETTCIQVQRFLMERGILVGAVRFPAAKKGGALLRLSLTALNTESQIEKILESLLIARDHYRF
jgi:7-keto-8-aminopelargonate synthetase-like enzyme